MVSYEKIASDIESGVSLRCLGSWGRRAIGDRQDTHVVLDPIGGMAFLGLHPSTLRSDLLAGSALGHHLSLQLPPPGSPPALVF